MPGVVSGAPGGARTHMVLRPATLKAAVYAVPPRGQGESGISRQGGRRPWQAILTDDEGKRILEVASTFHRYSSTTTRWSRTRSVLLRRLRPRAEGRPSAEGSETFEQHEISNVPRGRQEAWSPSSAAPAEISVRFGVLVRNEAKSLV